MLLVYSPNDSKAWSRAPHLPISLILQSGLILFLKTKQLNLVSGKQTHGMVEDIPVIIYPLDLTAFTNVISCFWVGK